MMNIDLQRKIDRFVGIIICGFFSLIDKFRSRQHEPSAPKKILIILLSEMGSLVLAKPMFDQLRKKYPSAQLHALLFAQNREILEILNVMPPKNIFTVRNKNLLYFVYDSLKVIYQMRKAQVDCIIDCELFMRISSIYAFLSGATHRVGFTPHTQEGLFRGTYISHPVLYNPYLHISQQFLNLTEALESNEFPLVKREVSTDKPELIFDGFAQTEVAALQKRCLKDYPLFLSKKLILIYPGGGLLPIRAWSKENYIELSQRLCEKEYMVGIIGLSEDKELATDIQSHCPQDSCLDLTGYTKTIKELILIFHMAEVLITNDGGPGHFAALTPIPAIIFFGPETPDLYGSLSPNGHHFFARLSCSPCLTAYNHRNSPCNGNNLCVQCISVDQVLEKVLSLIEDKE